MTSVVLILADQLRRDALGCYGNAIARTPAIDALAARGARLLDHHTPNQICAPSRATLFSGLQARRHGVVHNGIALDPGIELLTDAFARAGHRTHGVGKFHFQPILAPAELAMPESNAFWETPASAGWRGPFYGFDEVELVIGESVAATDAGHYAAWLRATAPEAVELYQRRHALAPPPADLDEVWKSAVPERLHYDSWIADRACAFIRSAGARDFLLVVSFPDPHHPFTPPAPWCDLVDPAAVALPRVEPGELARMPAYVQASARAELERGDDGYLEYLLRPKEPREQGFMTSTATIGEATLRQAIAHTHGMVAQIDAGIARIVETIAGAGRAADTVVALTTDHGELLGDHGLLRKGPPPYTQVLRLPLVIAGPGVMRADVAGLTSHVDLKATLLELCGVAGDAGDGRSFAPALRGEGGVAADALFAEYHPRARAEVYNQTIVTSDWRCTIYPRRAEWGELFDRSADPGEHRNLFHEPATAAMRDALVRRLAREWPPAPGAGGARIAVY